MSEREEGKAEPKVGEWSNGCCGLYAEGDTITIRYLDEGSCMAAAAALGLTIDGVAATANLRLKRAKDL